MKAVILALALAPPQAQVVLQGKSRSVIIRELQRTNLDVNLAVNNLLSRDDEDGDDGDDTASESYLPGGGCVLGLVLTNHHPSGYVCLEVGVSQGWL